MRALLVLLSVSLLGALSAACTARGAPNAAVPPDAVLVTHWAAGHLMPDHLMPKFAAEFNAVNHRTASGKRVEVRPVKLDSFEQVERLAAAAQLGKVVDPSFGEPTVVTPVVDHWLAEVNERVGRTVVDLSRTEELAIAWTGMATYREMAECLGWPQKAIGYEEIVRLRTDPRGWASCPTAKAAWGQQPLMSYTDPSTSSTGRSVLFGLYSVAARKPADQLASADVTDPNVVEYVKNFQQGVDHYVPNTLVLQTKMNLGYSHIYWIAEDTLVQLKLGKVPVGTPAETKIHPLAGKDLVFIYPKEGSIAHNNPAGIVQAPWVTAEQVEAAGQWIAFLRQDAQQNALMDEGFRPATPLPLRCPICTQYGLDPDKPTARLNPVKPAVGSAIVQAWDVVKKPGIVTFAVDVSGSMNGPKLDQAKKGLIQALDGLARNTKAGFLSFAGTISTPVAIAPIEANKFKIVDQVNTLRASGNTCLYDALAQAIAVTDAPDDPDAIRGVVLLTDGQDNCQRPLHDIVTMSSHAEVPLVTFTGRERESSGTDQNGTTVQKTDILGTGLKLDVKHPIHIFYVGVGQDADLEIGRILAEATNSASQGTTDKSLAEVLATFGKYF